MLVMVWGVLDGRLDDDFIEAYLRHIIGEPVSC
jgi:hypothetical protein